MGIHSLYEVKENSKLTRGMRIKLMRTCSASGHAALLSLVVSGLDESELIMTDDELKDYKGMYVMKIEGFSMHSSIDPLNKSVRYLMFLRSSKTESYSVEKSRCNCHNEDFFMISLTEYEN